MEIIYYEYYPHYSGTTTARAVVDIHALLLAQAVLKDTQPLREAEREKGNWSFEDEEEELVDEIADQIEKIAGKTTYFLNDALSNCFTNSDVKKGVKKILDSLRTKGYYVGESEEGSWYWAFPKQEKKAQKELEKYEQSMHEDDFGFEDY